MSECSVVLEFLGYVVCIITFTIVANPPLPLVHSALLIVSKLIPNAFVVTHSFIKQNNKQSFEMNRECAMRGLSARLI